MNRINIPLKGDISEKMPVCFVCKKPVEYFDPKDIAWYFDDDDRMWPLHKDCVWYFSQKEGESLF